MVLQMLDLLSSKRTLEKPTESGKGGHSSSKGDVETAFVSIDDINEGRNINIKDEDDNGDIEDIRKVFK